VAELIERTGAATVGLVKLDVEGAELDLFTGDTSWLERVQALAVEFHDRYRPGARAAGERAVAEAWSEYETSSLGEKVLFVRTGG
jgi:methyltransferase FkbM-like protein